MAIQPVAIFTVENTVAAYQLRFHYGWYTHGRCPLLSDGPTRSLVEQSFQRVTKAYDYHVLEYDLESAALRALLSQTPGCAPSAVTRIVKGNIVHDLKDHLRARDVWSRGSFVRGVGSRTNEVVLNYLRGQLEHHGVVEPGVEAEPLARFDSLQDPGQLRVASHVKYEYNLHVVLVTRWRFDFLEQGVGQALIECWRSVCEQKRWLAWDMEVLWDHVHLFLGVRPTDAPQDVALALMNDSEQLMWDRYGAALLQQSPLGVWRPSFYVGTVGSASTAQVKAYLENSSTDG